MAGLARRIAPAAALGGLAVVVVGLFDPALAARNAQAEPAPSQAVPQAEAAPVQAAPQQQSPQQPAQQQSQQQAAPQQQSQQQDTQATAADCSNPTQVTGQSAMTPWGPVQVVGSVAGGQLCEAHAVAYPSNDRKSQMINSYAIPQLDAQMSQGGTRLDFVSGATYTSNAYAQSLQSILDQM